MRSTWFLMMLVSGLSPAFAADRPTFFVHDSVEFSKAKLKGTVMEVLPTGKLRVRYPGHRPEEFDEPASSLKLLSHRYLQWVPSESGSPLGCQEKDASNPVYSRAAELSECDAVEPMYFYWTDTAKRQCSGVTRDGRLIGVVPANRCEGALPVNCEHGAEVVNAGNTAMIEGTLYHLIPEILRLSDGAPLPQSTFRKYDARLVAASAVARLHRSQESHADSAHPEFDFMRDTLIQMKFEDTDIANIRRSGFLNQHQVERSNGALNPSLRASYEDQFLKLQIEPSYQSGASNPANFLRPKYSYLAFDVDPDGEKRSFFWRGYGNVVAVFKDEVKDRSTFTPNDSLNIQGAGLHTFYYRSPNKVSLHGSNTSYWETQIWGSLEMSDVAYFLIHCPGDRAPQPKSLYALKATGIPIYECRFVPDHTRFAKGKLVYGGDASLAHSSPRLHGSEMERLRVP